MKEDDRAAVKEDAARETECRIRLARSITWQFEAGTVRTEDVVENEALYTGFANMDIDPDDGDGGIYIPFEGYHRSVYINKDSLDYISIPAHKFDAALLDVAASELD